MKSILDRSFRYVPAAETDLRKTFAAIRRKLKAKDSQPSVVREIKTARRGK